MNDGGQDEVSGGTELKDKIDHILTEARMVLPGAQALLGFQFVVVLMEAFETLPRSSQYVHLASLGCIAFATVLLMMPAAYHRLVEDGEDTERFNRFAGRAVTGAMVPLALGVSGDLFVGVRKVAGSVPWALGATALALVMFYGLWFGFTVYRRSQRPPHQADATWHA